MFGRKKTETEEDKPIMDTNDDLGIPGKPASRPGLGLNPPKMPVMPVRPSEPSRNEVKPGIEMPRRVEAPTPGVVTPQVNQASRREASENRKLIVGREIALSGEISSCDRLVVEGSVQANLANCHDIDIAESGLFKGSASIDEAEIRGRFEGELTVRNRLFIRATGQVVGTVRYGQLEIECGGRISGDVQMGAGADVAPNVPAKAFDTQVA
jgi:cytoskeletal protein CcmA (bactofilin family)